MAFHLVSLECEELQTFLAINHQLDFSSIPVVLSIVINYFFKHILLSRRQCTDEILDGMFIAYVQKLKNKNSSVVYNIIAAIEKSLKRFRSIILLKFSKVHTVPY